MWAAPTLSAKLSGLGFRDTSNLIFMYVAYKHIEPHKYFKCAGFDFTDMMTY